VSGGDLQALRELLGEVLDLGDRAAALTPDSPLLGALPEFDSLAVVSLITALQERFHIEIQDEDIDPDMFESVASLQRFIEVRREA
jgi:acyl carrier protein